MSSLACVICGGPIRRGARHADGTTPVFVHAEGKHDHKVEAPPCGFGVLRCYVCGEPVINHERWNAPCPKWEGETIPSGVGTRERRLTPHPSDSPSVRRKQKSRR